MRILFVEDDDRIAQPLAEDLSVSGIVDIAGMESRLGNAFKSVSYDPALLTPPQLDGITLCRRQLWLNVLRPNLTADSARYPPPQTK